MTQLSIKVSRDSSGITGKISRKSQHRGIVFPPNGLRLSFLSHRSSNNMSMIFNTCKVHIETSSIIINDDEFM